MTQLEIAPETLAASDFVALVNGHALKSYGEQRRTLTYTSIPDKEEYPRGRFSRIDEYRDRNSDVWYHRLCYQPCPADIDLSDRNAFETPLDETVLQYLNSGNSEIMRPFASLRFDYNADVSNATHPITHLSMLSADCRIPVVAPLGLDRFLRFVFENFYRDKWETRTDAIRPLHFDLANSMLEDEEQRMHLRWR